MTASGRLGIIGGSGLYRMPGLADAAWRTVETAWGHPSDQLLFGTLAGREIVFLPRHGRGHRIAPDEINARANIAALKAAGCTELLAVSAVGSFREDLAPGSFVVVDQMVDRTVRQPRSFFGDGIVGHVSFARPTCARLGALATAALIQLGVPHATSGTMLVIEGPQFSTAAESRLHRAWGMDVVGMTGLPEARLAREAELCYASVAMVTDYDAWSDASVSTDDIVRVLAANAGTAQALVAAVVATPSGATCGEGCRHALTDAVITARDAWPDASRARLALLNQERFG
ncbi:S-methyl-5'-thioadenosine phosphorylase [Sphingomonas jatrophae]|uniref:Purine nucleoside phosphorylase n=1 Tax=Sphingomonas jatrophae TaxID=1166337 RepID=A0A1I6K1H6_9SPHN|nr:S-methyl-5'-thioadenosine phosphorylase [Sphingomonas jatrophae]SFR85079.1 5'-methylthioadenosine phosphorylase [Sphingomonas jatrophae]